MPSETKRREVWKYPLELNPGTTTHEIPAGAHLVHGDIQYGVPTLWYEVDPDAPREPRTFALIGTGGTIEAGLVHVDSFLLAGGTLVLHAYEARPQDGA